MKIIFKKYPELLLVSIVQIVLLHGCTAVVEPDITNETVYLLAPADDVVTYNSTHNFWWEEVINAHAYQLQIVSPNFTSIERLFLDTLIDKNQFTVSLLPGVYEWRVKALNYSYETGFYTNRLTIDSSMDLSNDYVVLVQPSLNDTSNKSLYEFNWDKLYNAEYYIFELRSSENLIFSDTSSDNQLSYTLDTDGSYNWKVNAFNDISESPYSNRSFFRYTVVPSPPDLVIPEDGANFTSGQIIHFNWNRDSNSIPSINDLILVASDTSFTNIVAQQEVVNPSFDHAFDYGTFYWKVKSKDKAGNESVYSNKQEFKVYNK